VRCSLIKWVQNGAPGPGSTATLEPTEPIEPTEPTEPTEEEP
jgi:hypothetical protein